MVFESTNGPFSSIHTMDFGRDTLEINFILLEGIFELLRAFVVEDMEFWGVAVMDEDLMSGLPSSANGTGFAIGNRDCMDGIRVLVVEHKNIIVSGAGGDMETTGLVGIGLEESVVRKKSGTDLMRTNIENGGNIRIVSGNIDIERENGNVRSRSNISSFFILVAQSSRCRLGKMLGNELGGESWKGDKMTPTNSTKKG
jgi:hypothetical protein